MGVVRIHFTQQDLARVTVGQAPDPMLETMMSLRMLQRQSEGTVFDAWQPWARARFPRNARPVLALVPPDVYLPDFLTPKDTGGGLGDGIDALQGTPRSQLRKELAELSAYRRPPSWAGSLAQGEPQTLRVVGRAVRDYHQAVIAPVQQHLREQLDLNSAHILQSLARTGLDTTLNSLHPTIRWRPPALELRYPGFIGFEFHLNGRGFHIEPSFFCHPGPMVADTIPFTLTLPLAHHSVWQPPAAAARLRPPQSVQALDALLGSTRAAVLRAVVAAGQQTTTDLAQHTGISPSTVSHHTAILRDAGLLTTRRTGTSVKHAATALGLQLVRHPQTGRSDTEPD